MKLSGKIRELYIKEKNKGNNEFEYEKLIKYGLKYNSDFVEKLSDNEKKMWLLLQDKDFENKPIDLPIIDIPIENIVFSQLDISINKVESGKHKKGLPIFIKKNGDYYIISGNHRLFAQLIKMNKDAIQGYIKDFDLKLKTGGMISKGLFESLGSAKELGITPKIEGHDMIAKCDCGEKFSYQNSEKNIVWECPECKGMKRIKTS